MATAGGLAVYDILLKPHYIAYLESRGLSYGFKESFFAYSLVLVVAWVVGWWLTREQS